MCKQLENFDWNKFENDLENLKTIKNSLGPESNLYNSMKSFIEFVNLVKESNSIKKWKHSVSTGVIN